MESRVREYVWFAIGSIKSITRPKSRKEGNENLWNSVAPLGLSIPHLSSVNQDAESFENAALIGQHRVPWILGKGRPGRSPKVYGRNISGITVSAGRFTWR